MKKSKNKIALDTANTTVLMPVRVTPSEYKLIRKAAKASEDRYMTRFMRRVVMEAVKK